MAHWQQSCVRPATFPLVNHSLGLLVTKVASYVLHFTAPHAVTDRGPTKNLVTWTLDLYSLVHSRSRSTLGSFASVPFVGRDSWRLVTWGHPLAPRKVHHSSNRNQDILDCRREDPFICIASLHLHSIAPPSQESPRHVTSRHVGSDSDSGPGTSLISSLQHSQQQYDHHTNPHSQPQKLYRPLLR